MKSVLIIMLRQIGDVVLTTPVPHIMKKHYPGCRVDFLTQIPCDELLQNNPDIDNLFVLEYKASVKKMLAMGVKLRKERYDVVLDYLGNPRSAILARLTGAPVRIGFDVRGRSALYTKKVSRDGAYAVDVKKNILEALGIKDDWDKARVYFTDEEKAWAARVRQDALNTGATRMATVDAGHKDPARQWPEEQFGELCRYLLDKHGVRSVLIRGPNEEETASRVVELSGGAAYLPPPTTLRQMASLVEAADIHVGNCSAPRHVAVGVDTPSFTILGSSSFNWTHPDPIHTHALKGLDCQPCKKGDCTKEFICLSELSFKEVSDEFDRWVSQVLGW